MFKTKRKFFRKAMSFIVASGMLATYYVPEVKADGENLNGNLTNMTDNLGEIQPSWYIQPSNYASKVVTEEQDESQDSINAKKALKAFCDSISPDLYESQPTEFEISTPQQLTDFAQAVNLGNNFSGKTVKLTDDIDLEGSGISLTKTAIGGSGNFTLTIEKTNLWEQYLK